MAWGNDGLPYGSEGTGTLSVSVCEWIGENNKMKKLECVST